MDVGLKVMLKNLSYNDKHNFILLNLSRLIFKHGWKITCRDNTPIHNENGSGDSIEFDFVIPTARGAL